MKRRDILEASKLLRQHKMQVDDQAALGLALGYLREKKDGETTATFSEWLDEEVEDDEDEDEGDGADPTT